MPLNVAIFDCVTSCSAVSPRREALYFNLGISKVSNNVIAALDAITRTGGILGKALPVLRDFL
jgi:hypothetical protein